MDKLILKGDIAFSVSPQEIKLHPDCYIVVEKGLVEGIYEKLPENLEGLSVVDRSNKLIIPGFTDLHVHAPQFYQCGIGMDLELIDWLKKYTFKQEEKFSDKEYAEKVYTHFVDEMVRQGTLHASVYSTIHKEAAEILFEILLKKGIGAFVGKVNMDRNSTAALTENTGASIRDTEELIVKYKDHPRVKPILTPRFVPACSADLLQGLGQLAAKYGVPVQSHLSENRDEVKWVKELHPEVQNYSEVYNQKGLFGQTPTLMAHCIYLEDEEIEMMRKNNVIAVHCPESNLNLGSGIMPARKLLQKGIKVGLGSDVAGGHSLSMAKVMVRAIQLSKIIKVNEPEYEPLAMEEAFYMATKGNGSFFGKTGSFETGYSFDALVIEDTSLGDPGLSLIERLQRFIYIGDDRNIISRFVNGCSVT